MAILKKPHYEFFPTLVVDQKDMNQPEDWVIKNLYSCFRSSAPHGFVVLVFPLVGI